MAAPGRIERLTAAVVLDSGKAGAIPATQVQQLVANAIGVDARRGDTVQVDKLAFDTTAAEAAREELAAAEAAAKQAQYVDLGTKAGIGLLVLIALVVALRRSRRNRPPRVEAVARDLPVDQVLLAQEMQAALAGAMAPAALTSEAEDASRQRDRLREEVSAFVDSQPDEIAQLVQGWLSQRAK
jgi:flagellar M-ring protein FliF